jgi:putative transposase
VTNQSVLTEVQDRDRSINQMHKQKQKKQKQTAPEPQLDEVPSEPRQNLPPCDPAMAEPVLDATERLELEEIKVPEVRVWDYEELKRNYGKWW